VGSGGIAQSRPMTVPRSLRPATRRSPISRRTVSDPDPTADGSGTTTTYRPSSQLPVAIALIRPQYLGSDVAATVARALRRARYEEVARR